MSNVLKILKTAFVKKDKPIMTKEKHDNYLTLNQTEQLEILDKLSDKNKKRIGEWLDSVEIKENVDGEPYIASPFWGYIYLYRDISYATLYKWCAVNFERIRLAKLPKPLDMIIYYANKWKKKAKINPYTNKEIPISFNPNGEYVHVYKQIMDGLIEHILNTKTKKESSSGKRLSIEDCYKLKDSLPIHHTCVFKERSKDSKYQIYYDYLFIVYFIKSKTSQYDPAFKNELSTYIDLAVYNTSQFEYNEGETYIDFHYTNEYLYVFKFYKNYLLNTNESELSIHKLIVKLCIDIENILEYMREPQETKITSDVIDKIKFNMDVMKYCKEIFSKVPFDYFLEYIENPEKKNDRIILKEYLVDVLIKHKKKITRIEYIDISNKIMNYMGNEEYMEDESPSSNVFETLLSIYNTILKLYMDNRKNTIYKPIKDSYNINKGIEPQIPVKQQLPRELQMYKIRLNNLKNAAKSKSSNERKLREFEEANSSNKRKLKEFEENMKEHDDKKMKKYVFNKDVYDRIYEGKYTPKKRKELLSLNAYKRLKKDEPLLHVSNRKAKSYGSYGSYGSYKNIGKIHHSEYSGNSKAFTTISDKKNNKRDNNSNNSNGRSYKEVEGYYKNDIDPYTQEEFSEMTPKKQKYTSDIIYKNGTQEYHYRFDTVSIYNYILKCIDVCEKPINFFNRSELTDDDLDEICKKIKHFTKKPTYNLSSEIRPLLVDCSRYYDNCLEFEWWEDVKPEDKEKEIIGSINIYIAIKLGDIIFTIIEEDVLKLPIIFNSNNKYNKLSIDTLQLLQDKLSEDVFISRRFFPYRKNKPILNLPKFAFGLNDNADKTLERLKRYKDKIEQM
jgi:hypothetical protein